MQEQLKTIHLSFLTGITRSAATFNLLLISMLLAFTLQNGYAQPREHVTNTNGWYMLFGNHRLTNKWGLHTEYQWRRNDIITNWQQSLLRIGVDYRFNDNVMLTAGYGNIITYPYGELPTLTTFIENRIWENLLITQKVNRFYLQHRYRLEQRFANHYIKNAGGTPEKDKVVYTNRMRYLFSVTYPLNKKVIEKNTLFLRLYEEAFVNFGKNVGKNIFDQNRAYIALGYQINKQVNIQAGYLNHLVFKPDGIHVENNNTLQLGLTYNLDIRKQHHSAP